MTRPQLVPWFKYVSALTALLVLFQAFMAGRFLFEGSDLVDEHGFVANIVFLSALVQSGLLLGIGLPGPLKSRFVILNGLLVVAIVVQIALGYSDSGSATAWHVPNGVLIFGVACFIMALAAQLPRPSAA
jgi:hypothetical protein